MGDKAYDSDPLNAELAESGIELPRRANRKKLPTQAERKLRRYRRRWKVERLRAWDLALKSNGQLNTTDPNVESWKKKYPLPRPS